MAAKKDCWNAGKAYGSLNENLWKAADSPMAGDESIRFYLKAAVHDAKVIARSMPGKAGTLATSLAVEAAELAKDKKLNMQKIKSLRVAAMHIANQSMKACKAASIYY